MIHNDDKQIWKLLSERVNPDADTYEAEGEMPGPAAELDPDIHFVDKSESFQDKEIRKERIIQLKKEMETWKVDLEKEDHTYVLKTESTEISADLLKTQLQLSTDDARSVDSVVQPFIVLEYLIKI